MDDTKEQGEQLCNLLELNGFQTDMETNPHLVRTRIRENHYDVVFSDIVMPEFRYNGIDVLVDVNTFSPTSEIVLLTGQIGAGMPTRVAEGMSLGASDFIELGPGVSAQTYLDKIEKVLNQNPKFNLPGLSEALIRYLWERLQEQPPENHPLKGQDLEGILKLVFESIEGFQNVKTLNHDPDGNRFQLEVENRRNDVFWRGQGERIRVECCNWSGIQAGPEAFALFQITLNQMADTNPLGVFISHSGFTDNFREQIAVTTADRLRIVLIDDSDLETLVHAADREIFLKSCIQRFLD